MLMASQYSMGNGASSRNYPAFWVQLAANKNARCAAGITKNKIKTASSHEVQFFDGPFCAVF